MTIKNYMKALSSLPYLKPSRGAFEPGLRNLHLHMDVSWRPAGAETDYYHPFQDLLWPGVAGNSSK